MQRNKFPEENHIQDTTEDITTQHDTTNSGSNGPILKSDWKSMQMKSTYMTLDKTQINLADWIYKT